MSKMDSTSHLIELMPQAAVVVDVQSKEVIFSNSLANALLPFACDNAIRKIDHIARYISSPAEVSAVVRKELQTTGKSILRHVCITTADHKIGHYDIHVSYMDETCTSVCVIFALSAHELQRMVQQNAYYSDLSDAAYSYPFHLDVKTRRMEFFNPRFETEYHIPLIMDNFPEPLFDYNYICEEDIEAYKATIDRMYKGEPPQGSFRFYDVKGELLRYSVNYVVNRDVDGQPMDVNGDFIIQSSAKKVLEYKVKLQDTVNECIDCLFTVGVTSQDPHVAYTALLNHLKDYYHAEGAYFYKFMPKVHSVERVHTVFDAHLEGLERTLPSVVNAEELKLMHILADANSTEIKSQLDSFSDSYLAAFYMQQQAYQITAFACASIKNVTGDTVAFIGVINPKLHRDSKELMQLLSRPICMFIEFQQEQQMKQELLKLEAHSKANVVKECVENFREFTHHKEHVTAVLHSLCAHYDADFAVTLTSDKENDGDYGISHIGGALIPNLAELQRQPACAMKKWEKIFKKHKHFITDADLDNPAAKQLLQEKFGIYNFIAAPIQDEHGILAGLLYVMNYKTLNRSNLLTHIVANNISAYLDKIHLYEQKHLESLTKLTDKVATQNQISEYLEDGTKGALFIIDIDHFKALNDTLGHQFGDKAIVALADTLKKNFRNTDVIGRVGGDEFMVFCPNLVSEQLIHEKAQQLLEQCHLNYEKDGMRVQITVSIGICRVTENSNTFQSLYEKADEVLYVSKHNGKNQYRIYNVTTHDTQIK